MKPDISEFSYGYAITDDLIRWVGMPISAAPAFPSLLEEGRPGGGYDLRLEFLGIPLFLQFKLSDHMTTSRTKEFSRGLFRAPFYRMHLRPLRHSLQHNLMLALEMSGNQVFYAAPLFHQAEELNRAYLNHEVVRRSVFIRPSDIGPLPDNEGHHVSFQASGEAYLLSEPVVIRILTGEFLARNLLLRIRERRVSDELSDNFWVNLRNRMIGISIELSQGKEVGSLGYDAVLNMHPYQAVAYLARMSYSCEMFLVNEKLPNAAWNLQ